jgi:hypothetical protein
MNLNITTFYFLVVSTELLHQLLLIPSEAGIDSDTQRPQSTVNRTKPTASHLSLQLYKDGMMSLLMLFFKRVLFIYLIKHFNVI